MSRAHGHEGPRTGREAPDERLGHLPVAGVQHVLQQWRHRGAGRHLPHQVVEFAHVAGPRLYPLDKFTGFKYPKEEGRSHWHTWVDACLAGKKTSDGFHYAGPLAETVQLGNVATRLAIPKIDPITGRMEEANQVLEWDAANLKFTNAPEAGIFTVMARTDPSKKGADGISAFIVERGTPGLSFGPHDAKMGHRGAHTCDVIFDDCRVPAANLIGEREGVGFKTAMKVLDKGRINIAAISVGVAERMLADALRYACERRQFGKPIAEFQLIQAMLADSKAEIYAARCMVQDAARRRDQGLDVSTEAACAKMFASEMCGRVADRAVHDQLGRAVDPAAQCRCAQNVFGVLQEIGVDPHRGGAVVAVVEGHFGGVDPQRPLPGG